jgi:hypothetical protein
LKEATLDYKQNAPDGAKEPLGGARYR